jgi:hypothetical protein
MEEMLSQEDATHLVCRMAAFQTEQSLHHLTGTTTTEHQTLDLTLSVVDAELVHGHQNTTDEDNGFKLILVNLQLSRVLLSKADKMPTNG